MSFLRDRFINQSYLVEVRLIFLLIMRRSCPLRMGNRLRTFEVAGDDGLFYPAQAVVENGKIKVWSDKVKEPETVRYGWQPFTRANLVNGAGLPASTFRAE